MALETLAYEQKYDEMLKREASALAEMKDTPEASLGYYWVAKARVETGDAKGASEILDGIIESKIPTTERFKGVDMIPQAKRLAVQAYEKLGDSGKVQALTAREH